MSADLFIGVAAGVVVLVIGGVARLGWLRRHEGVTVELESDAGDAVLHVTNGARPIRVNAYGLGGQTHQGYEDIPLHRKTLITAGSRQDSIVSLPPHAEERFRPGVAIGSELLSRGVTAESNRMRVRPFVRVEGRRKAYHGRWLVYELQARQAK